MSRLATLRLVIMFTASEVFPADPVTGEPALNYREMFQFLPFQVTNGKFVISTYVMSWNIISPPASHGLYD